MKKFVIFIIIHTFFGLFCVSADTDKQKQIIKQVREYLSHCNTYYWLSRVRGDDLYDIEKNIEYAKKAKALLKQADNSQEAKELLKKVDIILTEAETQFDIAKDSVAGYSKLIPFLLKSDKVYEFFDTIDEVAVARSIASLCEKIPKLEFMLYVIIISDNKNKHYEEIAHSYINTNTGLYVLTQHEILNVISQKELNLLYESNNHPKILEKLASAFSADGIGIIRISENDRIDNLFYAGASFTFWDAFWRMFHSECYSDGFAERPPVIGWIYIFFLAGLLFTLLYNTLNKKKSKGSFPPLWYGTLSAALSFIMIHTAISAISKTEIIDGGALLISPTGLSYLTILVALIFILPPILLFIASVKLPRVAKILNNAETISSLTMGAFLGGIIFISGNAGFVYPEKYVFMNTILCLSMLFFPIFLLGRAYSRYALQNDNSAGYVVLALALLFISTFFSILKYDHILILYTAAALNLCAPALFFGIPLCPSLFRKIKEYRQASSPPSLRGIEWLKGKLNTPPFYCCNKKIFDNAVKWITDDKDEKIDMIFIEADQGCGKTRMAFEIAHKVAEITDQRKKESLHRKLKENEKTIILFGDCDDPTAGIQTIPYEPFAQALGNFLGIGHFKNPTEKAEKLKNGLAGIALETAMNAAGLAAFSNLIGAGEETETAKTDVKEMTKVIAETLSHISQTRKIIFILDDTHWIDDETFELFELLLYELQNNFKENQINFILTSRNVDENDKVKQLFNKLDNTGSTDKTDIIDVFYIKQGDLQSDTIVEGILENLRFDYNAQEQLIGYFSGENRPLPVLMTLKLLLDKNKIIEIGERFELSEDANLSELPQPDYYSDILRELTADMSLKEMNLLQCCAIIGRSFNVSIVSEIFGIPVLETLELLKKAEKKNIIRDVLEEDDVFEFVEKRVANIFRKLNQKDNDKLIQEVREYHKKFVEIKNRKPIETLTYQEIIAAANHASAVQDVYPEFAVKYNRLAAIKTHQRGLLKSADKYFQNALRIIEDRKTVVSTEEKTTFFLSYLKCLLDEEANINIIQQIMEKLDKILKNSSASLFQSHTKDFYSIELTLINVLILYKLRNFSEAVQKSEEILNNASATFVQKIRAEFYRAISWNRKEYEKCKQLHSDILEKINNLLSGSVIPAENRMEILKIKAELCNNFGFIILTKDPKNAMKYFRQAIKINEIPEINNQKGIAISHGGIGDCLNALGELNGAMDAYLINYNISKRNGDNQGIIRMSSMLGGLILRQAENLSGKEKNEKLAEAAKYYRESLHVAEHNNNIIGIVFALAGLLNVASASEHPNLDYAIEKFKHISLDRENIPDFALEALHNAVKNLKKHHPSMANTTNIFVL